MTDPIRAALERAARELDYSADVLLANGFSNASNRAFNEAHAARVALAAKPPTPASVPSEEDLADLAEVFNGDPVPAIRRALELWGRPTIPTPPADPDALAAQPAEPDTGAVLDMAAIIRRVDGNHSLGAAALAEAILSHPNAVSVAASVLQPPAPVPPADGEAEELAQVLESQAEQCAEMGMPDWAQFSRRAAALLREARPQPPQGGEVEP